MINKNHKDRRVMLIRKKNLEINFLILKKNKIVSKKVRKNYWKISIN